MKSIIFSLLALAFATNVLADIPEIRAKEVSCQELQDAVKNYSSVTVLYRPFLFMKRLTVSSEQLECSSSENKTQAFFKTTDVAACAAGFFCEARPVVIIHEPRPFPHPTPYPHPIPHPMPHPHPGPTPHAPRGPHYDPRPHTPSHHEGPSHTNPGPRYNPRPGGCHARHC